MANPSVNRINTSITPADTTAINNALNTALTTLATYTQALTEDERTSLFSLSEENLVFAQEALAQGQLLNAGFPAPIQSIVTNMSTDLNLFGQLNGLDEGNIAQLALRVKDTKRLTAHEAYSGALAVYKFIEAGASLGMQGYQAAFDALKVRFANQGGSPPVPGP